MPGYDGSSATDESCTQHASFPPRMAQSCGATDNGRFCLLLVVAYATFFTIIYWSFIDGYADSVVESYARYIVAPVRIAADEWYSDPGS